MNSPHASELPTKRILLAEDNDAMRVLLACTLRRLGFGVDPVRDGAGLIQRLCSAEEVGALPNVVVSNAFMPGINGLHVLAVIRLIAPNVPVVLITAFGERRADLGTGRPGPYAVIDRPFDLRRFSQVLRDLAGGGSYSWSLTAASA